MAPLSDTLLGLTGSVTRATDRLTLLESSARRKFTNISDEEALMDVFKMGSSLWKLPVEDVGETKELSNIFGEVNHAVAVDCVNNHLYWTNPETGIRRSRYDGSDNHLVVTKAPIYFGLAVDFVSGICFGFKAAPFMLQR
ncbi:hypothetical protein BV898_19120 [Hypsibius exemplaris]|uniref:Uncharacterized protein n=1 Tax=Hypsibius exemplaris TaxID=2072580 RepID=A0A9X6NK70_HYPEX|nr:hypothetical protein BV898_19120 [Hypsibius exemplaris]